MFIDKEKLIERIYQKIELTYSAQVRQGLTIAQNIIREFSGAERPTGEWIYQTGEWLYQIRTIDSIGFWYCSECKAEKPWIGANSNYCPNCRARMKKEEGEE